MNRPQPIVYAFGNPVSSLFFYGFTTVVGYELCMHQASGLFFLITIVMCSFASKCSKELAAYKAWKTEWDSLEGDHRQSFFATRPRLKELLYFVVFIASAFITAMSVDYDTGQFIGGCVGVGIWVFTIKWVVQWWRGRKARPKAAARKDMPVTVCLSVPTASPDPQQTFAALPPYCKYLLLKKANG